MPEAPAPVTLSREAQILCDSLDHGCIEYLEEHAAAGLCVTGCRTCRCYILIRGALSELLFGEP